MVRTSYPSCGVLGIKRCLQVALCSFLKYPIDNSKGFKHKISEVDFMKICFSSNAFSEFHNIGQGLFCSGRFRNFYFVYDCGTKKHQDILEERIDKYVDSLANKQIDALVISHLHFDHVSGLDKLLKLIKVKTVYLPYLLPAERFALAMNYSLQRNFETIPAWYLDFLIDPTEWLLGKNIGTIVFFRSNNKPNVEKYFDVDSESPADSKKDSGITADSDLLDQLEDDEDLKSLFNTHEQHKNYESKVLFKNDKEPITRKPDVNIKFYNVSTDGSKINNFGKMLKNLGFNTFSQSEIKKFIIDTSLREKVKDAYKKVWRDLNKTSLCMNVSSIQVKTIPNIVIGDNIVKLSSRGISGMLLTGDLSLANKKILDEFSKHYKEQLPHVSIFQLPHHGAKGNWSKELLSQLPHTYIWVASAAKNSQYGHPSSYVLNNIVENDRFFIWVNENTDRIFHSFP